MKGPRASWATLMLGACASLATSPHASAAESRRERTIGDLKETPVEVRPDAPVDASAARAIENYRRFLEQQTTDPRLRAQALRRLGDLHLESGELDRIEKETTALDQRGAEAIRIYMALLETFPDYPRNDQVLYQLARAYETTGQPEQALGVLDRLVLRHPQSPLVEEAQFRRGELLFSAARYAEAEQAYGAITRRRRVSPFYEQSLYKHGWALFKQSRNEESLPLFATLLDEKLLSGGGQRVADLEQLARADRELVEDTLRVMSITFSEGEGAAMLDEFLRGRGNPPYSHLLYAHLGDLYLGKERYQDAAATYRAYVTRSPDDENAPLLAIRAIEAYRQGGFDQLVLESQREFATQYHFEAPFWRGRAAGTREAVVNELKASLKAVATHHHAAAQASRQADEFRQAAHWYREFLRSFPQDAESAATHYLLADALFESGDYLAAAEEYERTAYDYPSNEKSAAAGYAALVAYERAMEQAGAPADAEPRNRAIEASIRFARNFPAHPQSTGVLVRAAERVFEQGDPRRALRIAQMVLDHEPAAEPARQRIAWTIIGQSLFDMGALSEAERAFLAARELAPSDSEVRADLAERLASAIYKQAEAKQSGGDALGAVEDFLRVARTAPESTIRATAQYDAGAQLIRLEQWDRAIGVLEAFRRDFPQHALVPEATRSLAVAYTKTGRSAQAAAEFERVAVAAGTDQTVRREALLQAADLYEQAQDVSKSVAVLERFVADHPVPVVEAVEVRQRLLDHAIAQGNVARQQHWQREIVKADAEAGAERTDRTRYLAARAQLALAHPARDAFRSVRLVAPLRTSLAAKRRALDAALEAYKRATDYRVAEVTTAATYEMAELYRTLGRDLLESERPRRLSQQELEEYELLLEEQAYPFEEQAIAMHEVNTARTREGLYDDSIRKSFAALAEISPARYGKTEMALEPLNVPDASSVLVRGIRQRAAGNLPEAESTLRTLAEGEATNVAAWNELGVTLRMQGRFGEALAAYERALAVDPGYAAAHRNRGVLLDLYLDEPEAALSALERYRELTGEDRPVSTWIAELRQRTGRRDESAGTDLSQAGAAAGVQSP